MGTIDVVSLLLALVGVGLGALTFVITAGLGPVRLLATVLIGGSAFLFGLLVGKALSGVAKTALYVYATESTAPEFFEDMDLCHSIQFVTTGSYSSVWPPTSAVTSAIPKTNSP